MTPTEGREAEDFEDFYDDACPDCHDEGWVVVCIDDICHGQGWCMHGDGDMPCSTCNDEGVDPPYPSELPRYAIENGWRPAP